MPPRVSLFGENAPVPPRASTSYGPGVLPWLIDSRRYYPLSFSLYMYFCWSDCHVVGWFIASLLVGGLDFLTCREEEEGGRGKEEKL